MLHITIPAVELFDDDKQEFISTKKQTLQLEHSLVSLSKWESKWCKPFLSSDVKTTEETIDYIRCMTITQNVNPDVYNQITDAIIDQITVYIDAKMTATWFNEDKKSPQKKEVITAEIIYYWMIALNIPTNYEKWHLNRLLTLIRVCDIKNNPPKKKRSKREIMAQNRALNAARRNSLNTKG